MKPKVHLNHQEPPGKGKKERVNANEPLMRLRDSQVAGMMVNQDGNDGSLPRLQGQILGGHLDPGVEKAPIPFGTHWCETW